MSPLKHFSTVFLLVLVAAGVATVISTCAPPPRFATAVPTSGELETAREYAYNHRLDHIDYPQEGPPPTEWARVVVTQVITGDPSSPHWEAKTIDPNGNKGTIVAAAEQEYEMASKVQAGYYITFCVPWGSSLLPSYVIVITHGEVQIGSSSPPSPSPKVTSAR